MEKDFLKDFEILDHSYEEKQDRLVDGFIVELDLRLDQQEKIRDILEKLKNYSMDAYKHSMHVAFRAYDLGQKYLNQDDPYYTLTEKEFKDLCVAAILHDAGKLDIDLKILEKPSSLESEEFEIMKSHATKTADHIKDVFPKEVVDIAVHHHEKLNGSGYPSGWTEDKINLSTRILTVADITSALVQKRVYKDSFTIAQIKKELAEDVLAGEIDPIITNDVIEMVEHEDLPIPSRKNGAEKK